MRSRGRLRGHGELVGTLEIVLIDNKRYENVAKLVRCLRVQHLEIGQDHDRDCRRRRRAPCIGHRQDEHQCRVLRQLLRRRERRACYRGIVQHYRRTALLRPDPGQVLALRIASRAVQRYRGTRHDRQIGTRIHDRRIVRTRRHRNRDRRRCRRVPRIGYRQSEHQRRIFHQLLRRRERGAHRRRIIQRHRRTALLRPGPS